MNEHLGKPGLPGAPGERGAEGARGGRGGTGGEGGRGRRDGSRWTAALALVLAAVSLLVCAVLFSKLSGQDDQITGNRVEQTRQNCRVANEERAILRGNFTRQLEQTRLVPEEAFEQFNVTKADAIERLKASRAALHPLDCRARVAAVHDSLD